MKFQITLILVALIGAITYAGCGDENSNSNTNTNSNSNINSNSNSNTNTNSNSNSNTNSNSNSNLNVNGKFSYDSDEDYWGTTADWFCDTFADKASLFCEATARDLLSQAQLDAITNADIFFDLCLQNRESVSKADLDLVNDAGDCLELKEIEVY